MPSVGVLSLPFSVNYGGILQGVALYTYITQQGFKVYYFDKRINIPPVKRLAYSVLERVPLQNFRGVRAAGEGRNAHMDFIRRNMNLTKQVRTNSEMARQIDRLHLDALVVGSDQVWRPEYQGDGGEFNYFLDFPNRDIKRISYAASFGQAKWVYPQSTNRISQLLAKFDAVSVREDSGVEICRSVFKRQQCSLVADPTLLLPRSAYENMATEGSGRDNTILVYVLDKTPQVEAAVAAVHATLGRHLSICYICPTSNDKPHDIATWLSLFSRTKFVITDSYHGTIFSMIFHKPFVTLGNEVRGLDRISSLLSKVGLLDRVMLEGSEREATKIAGTPIDYDVVDEKLSLFRRQSQEFLDGALKLR